MSDLSLCYSGGKWWLAANGQPVSKPVESKRTVLPPMRGINSDTAVNLAATLLELEPEMVTGTTRIQPCVRARQIITLVMRESGMSYGAIGRRLDKDHTSIIYFFKTGSERRWSDPMFEADYQRVRAALLGASAA